MNPTLNSLVNLVITEVLFTGAGSQIYSQENYSDENHQLNLKQTR